MLGLRLADPFLQYKLLRDGHAAALMQSALRIPHEYALSPAVLAVPGISKFSIGGLNEVASTLVAMYGVAGLRHVRRLAGSSSSPQDTAQYITKDMIAATSLEVHL